MSTIPQSIFIQPYSSLTAIINNGINYVSANLGSPATMEKLQSTVRQYLLSTFYPSGTSSPDQTIDVKAVVANVFNQYIDPCYKLESVYTSAQMQIINHTMKGIQDTSIVRPNYQSLQNYISLVNEGIVMSCMSTAEQAPLLMASALVLESYKDVLGQIASPNANWIHYLDTDPAVNLGNINGWAVATYICSLIGATQSIPVVPTTAPQGTGLAVNIISTVGGALTGLFGSAVMHWEQRPEHVC